ncbi:MAG: helix-turn-helix transcriptional regulator [Actinomycetota bacterium]|nr:helix-turn-helix transcriptional regulator [Actinomycetota bacterium]
MGPEVDIVPKQPKAGGDKPGSAEDFRARSLLRPAILLLLKERESHGYELVSRLSDLGFDVPDFGGLYRALRAMEDEGLITSSWGTPERGPARRVYSLTSAGDAHLRQSAPGLVHQRRTIGGLLERYRGLVHQERRSKRHRRRVLVVEDDDDMRHTLWVLLEQRKWLVDEAPDGETALALWAKNPPEIMVLDQRLPDMPGVEVARQVREQGYEGHILLYSAYLSRELEDEAAILGIQSLGKADFDELFDALAAFEGDDAPPRRAVRN